VATNGSPSARRRRGEIELRHGLRVCGGGSRENDVAATLANHQCRDRTEAQSLELSQWCRCKRQDPFLAVELVRLCKGARLRDLIGRLSQEISIQPRANNQPVINLQALSPVQLDWLTHHCHCSCYGGRSAMSALLQGQVGQDECIRSCGRTVTTRVLPIQSRRAASPESSEIGNAKSCSPISDRTSARTLSRLSGYLFHRLQCLTETVVTQSMQRHLLLS
jgi:hypothetical protein